MSSRWARDLNLKLHAEGDALDFIGTGLAGCILTPEALHPDFFELRNGLLGAAFQKFMNYHFKAAILLPEDHGYGERVTELMRDHRRHPYIRFFTEAAQAEAWVGDG